MNIKEFLFEKKRLLLLAGLIMIISCVVSILVFPAVYHLPLLLIIVFLSLFLVALSLLDELRGRTALHELILQDLEELAKTPGYSVPVGGTLEEQELSNGINALGKYIQSLRTENEKERSDISDYIRIWSPKLEENLIEFRNIANSGLKSDLPNLLERQADQTNLVVQQLLYYLRTKTDGIDSRKVPVSINEMALQTIKRYYSLMQEKRIGYLIKGQDIIINTDPDVLGFALGQVLHNAIKYTPRKGSIGIYIKKYQDNYYLIVEDKGSGISPSDLPHVFDKNYVGKNEQDEKSPGMGLYLAKSFVELLGYQIGLNSKLNQGTTVAICFAGETPIGKNGRKSPGVPQNPTPPQTPAPTENAPPRPKSFDVQPPNDVQDMNETEETYLADDKENPLEIERFVSRKPKSTESVKKFIPDDPDEVDDGYLTEAEEKEIEKSSAVPSSQDEPVSIEADDH